MVGLVFSNNLERNQVISTNCVYSDVDNHLEFESQNSEAILMLQGLGDLFVVNVPVDHVELHWIPYIKQCQSTSY